MFKFRYFIIIPAIIVFSCSCKQEKVDFTIVQTGEVLRVDYTTVKFSAKVINLVDSIIEYGFKWDLQIKKGESGKAYQIAFKGNPKNDFFEAVISSSMEPYRDYFVRAYVKTANGISYGRNVEFTGEGTLPFQILELNPDSVLLYDTIMIIGNNFGYRKEDVTVKAGSVYFSVLRITPDTIFAKIPLTYNLAASTLNLKILSNSGFTEKQLFLKKTIITSFSPLAGKAYTHLTLYVKNFRPYYNPTIFALKSTGGFGDFLTVASMNKDTIYCNLPFLYTGLYSINFSVGENQIAVPGQFTVLPSPK